MTAFLTIHAHDHLTPRAHRRALRVGPRASGTRGRTHLELMQRAGFGEIEVEDVTPEFRRVQDEWIRLWDEHAEALAALLGAGELRRIQRERRALLAATDDGLLVRSLVSGRR